jgi:CRP/FNR family transcriptional regulator
MTNRQELLRELPIFEALSAERLAKVADYCMIRSLERNEALWHEGAMAHSYAFIISGHVKICRLHEDGRETILGVFGEGEPVGHVAVYRRIAFPASAIALSDVCVAEIQRTHMTSLMHEDPELMDAVLFGMMERARYLANRVHELTASSAEQRLALLFRTFSETLGVRQQGEDGTTHIKISLSLSRQDIASLIKTRVETAIRMMSRWHKESLLLTCRDGFVIMDHARLELIAQGQDC